MNIWARIATPDGDVVVRRGRPEDTWLASILGAVRCWEDYVDGDWLHGLDDVGCARDLKSTL